MDDVRNAPGLASVLASPALARLVIHFALHPDAPIHLRALGRRTRLGRRSLENELRRLEAQGLIERWREGRNVLFRAVQEHPGWRAMREMVRQFADPAEVLSGALALVDGVEAAFVFGSFARGDTRPDSDVDLFVVADEAVRQDLGREAAEASILLGRPVEVLWYSRDKLRQRLESGHPLVGRVLGGPKRWVVPDRSGALPAAA
ncbi:MAG TPA: nucleotidyltransferase domain-containing protein [Longimicrobiaceae bacterium]|nr:nucleotidyltransferase domain-containing protein [Longimicrobiaceae bacterium]